MLVLIRLREKTKYTDWLYILGFHVLYIVHSPNQWAI